MEEMLRKYCNSSLNTLCQLKIRLQMTNDKLNFVQMGDSYQMYRFVNGNCILKYFEWNPSWVMKRNNSSWRGIKKWEPIWIHKAIFSMRDHHLKLKVSNTQRSSTCCKIKELNRTLFLEYIFWQFDKCWETFDFLGNIWWMWPNHKIYLIWPWFYHWSSIPLGDNHYKIGTNYHIITLILKPKICLWLLLSAKSLLDGYICYWCNSNLGRT